MPNKVEHLFYAQLFHDRKQQEARSNLSEAELAQTPVIDYLRPIIADADMGLVLYRCHHEFYLIQLP